MDPLLSPPMADCVLQRVHSKDGVIFGIRLKQQGWWPSMKKQSKKHCFALEKKSPRVNEQLTT